MNTANIQLCKQPTLTAYSLDVHGIKWTSALIFHYIFARFWLSLFFFIFFFFLYRMKDFWQQSKKYKNLLVSL